MKKLLPFVFLFFPLFAYAASGACSDHGGINCSAGAGIYGQVVCNDGWTGSSSSFTSAIECQTPPVRSNTLLGLKQTCASYANIIKNENNELNVRSEANSKVHPDTSMVVTLDEMFYSPVVNSCLYTQTVYLKMPSITVGAKVIPASSSMTYSIRDYLNNESELYAVVVDTSEINSSKAADFDAKVSYYKGDTGGSVTASTDNEDVHSTDTQTHTKVLEGVAIGATQTDPSVKAGSPSVFRKIYQFIINLFKF